MNKSSTEAYNFGTTKSRRSIPQPAPGLIRSLRRQKRNLSCRRPVPASSLYFQFLQSNSTSSRRERQLHKKIARMAKVSRKMDEERAREARRAERILAEQRRAERVEQERIEAEAARQRQEAERMAEMEYEAKRSDAWDFADAEDRGDWRFLSDERARYDEWMMMSAGTMTEGEDYVEGPPEDETAEEETNRENLGSWGDDDDDM